MDHASAHLMEFSRDLHSSKTIESEFTHEAKVHSIGKSEHGMHDKEQHQQAAYYKKLGDVIKNYDEVILFGPTDAKSELLNVLREDHLFSKIKLEIRQTDKMTENQQLAFVREHFS